MKTKAEVPVGAPETFTVDAVEMMRAIRDRMSTETAGMTLAQLQEYMRRQMTAAGYEPLAVQVP